MDNITGHKQVMDTYPKKGSRAQGRWCQRLHNQRNSQKNVLCTFEVYLPSLDTFLRNGASHHYLYFYAQQSSL